MYFFPRWCCRRRNSVTKLSQNSNLTLRKPGFAMQLNGSSDKPKAFTPLNFPTNCYFALLPSALLQTSCALLPGTRGHQEPAVITQWLTDLQALLSSFILLQVIQIAGAWWMAPDRRLTATGGRNHADSAAIPPPPPPPGQKPLWGHSRRLHLCEEESLSTGDILSDKGSDCCGLSPGGDKHKGSVNGGSAAVWLSMFCRKKLTKVSR